jgi:hypothetical protein
MLLQLAVCFDAASQAAASGEVVSWGINAAVDANGCSIDYLVLGGVVNFKRDTVFQAVCLVLAVVIGFAFFGGFQLGQWWYCPRPSPSPSKIPSPIPRTSQSTPRNVSVQAPCTYKYHMTQPRFHPLPVRAHGAWPEP